MKSTISWIDREQLIILVESVGLWDATTLLLDTQKSLTENPQYIIWNPTNVMFPAEHNSPLEEISPKRKELLDKLAQAFLSGQLQLLVIIRTKQHVSFDRMANLANQIGFGHFVKFVKSPKLSLDLIAKHQAEGD